MKLLLDTHILLWTLADDPRLPSAARELIENAANAVWYSTASLWEVSIKHAAHPDRMLAAGSEIARFSEEAGFDELPICSRHVAALETLRREPSAPSHNDPFDRIMLAQAKSDGLLFVTHDGLIPAYGEPCVLAV